MLTRKEIDEWYADYKDDGESPFEKMNSPFYGIPYIVLQKEVIKNMPLFWQKQFDFMLRLIDAYGIKSDLIKNYDPLRYPGNSL